MAHHAADGEGAVRALYCLLIVSAWVGASACVDLTRPPALDCVGAACAAGPSGRDATSPVDGPDARPGADVPDPGAGAPVDGSVAPLDGPMGAPGTGCTSAADCHSGFCVDGVCCDSACEGICQACNLGGAVGVCTPVPAGADPGDECPAEEAVTCGKDGTCNGAGACRLFEEGTVCLAGTCTGGEQMAARTCDGRGVCKAAEDRSCGLFSCAASGQACLSKCESSGDCLTPNLCVAGVCQPPKALGEACGAAGECASGFCEQGVCCGGACKGTCYSCALAGSVGVCKAVPAGQDPLDQCADQGAASCGRDGTCNGAGACRTYAAGTECAAATCTNNTFTAARACDGMGTCAPAPAATSCAPFTCDGAACRTRCNNNVHCVSGSTCMANKCTANKKTNGTACAAGTECVSGICVQGVCCNAACDGVCRSCKLVGQEGTCTNVPAGQDPFNQCADQGAASCGTDGQCNGAGACRRYAAGTSCGAPTCANGTASGARTCDGNGTCQPASVTSCGSYTCAGAECRQSCGSNADCVAPSICHAGQCGGLKGEYFADRTFGALRHTRVDGVVNFDFGSGVPAPDMPADNFTIRWTGKVVPRFSETYTFHTISDDGVRLWVDGVQVINNWTDHGNVKDSGTLQKTLTAGQAYDLRLEYYEAGGGALIRLFWSSPSQAEEIIPAARTIPAP